MYMLCVSGWGKKENMLVMLFLSRKKKKKIAAVTQNPAFCGLAALRKNKFRSLSCDSFLSE